MERKYETGYAIEKSVEAVVNSANDGLLLGTSGAGAIRKATGFLKQDSPELKEYEALCNDSTGIGRLGRFCKRWELYDKIAPGYVQLECLRKIKENEGWPFEIGTAEITSSGEFIDQEGKPKYIIHAIGMGYKWPRLHDNPLTGEKNKRPEIRATVQSIENALNSTFELAKKYNIRSLAIPIMCARVKKQDDGSLKVYGLTPENSYNVLEKVLSQQENSIDRVIICADNDSTAEYLKSINKL